MKTYYLRYILLLLLTFLIGWLAADLTRAYIEKGEMRATGRSGSGSVMGMWSE
jgi:hypothetical protein